MGRNVIGSLLALLGAAAVVYSPFRPWYGGRSGQDFRLDELFQGGGITGADAALFTGLFVLMLIAAVVAVLGVLLQSRLTVLFAGVLALGFTILWMVRQGQAAGSISAGNTGGLASGAWLALGGALLILLAGALMAGPRTLSRRRHAAGRRAARVRGEPGREEDTLEQPFAGPPPPQQPYQQQRPYPEQPPYQEQPPYPGQPGMRGAPSQEPYPPGPPPPEPGSPPPDRPFKGPEQQYPEEQYPEQPYPEQQYLEEREPYESQPGTQGAPLDEPYERRPEAPRPAAEEEPPPDNTRRFPTTPPPEADEQHPDEEDTGPHRGRNAA
ncbi:hypothetical protein ITI46_14985 [Streptomyces oryzae]|uniref:Uncharacterized protein n=1 Tax=Streptomyces oryzae TaxID=1434886 RepID=A0ABS3XC57_9ACTN|nr:hypothetical protein [Streptomyces oryzae]MBO8192963.1 hypothetical protein [Streptomyces oryzae]